MSTACSSDDPLPSAEADSTFGRVLRGELGAIPNPEDPGGLDDNCFGLGGTDPLAGVDCPFIIVEPPDIPLVLDGTIDAGMEPDNPQPPPWDGNGPDLVMASQQAAIVDENNAVHVIVVRNIGNEDSIISLTEGEFLTVQFYATTEPTLEGDSVIGGAGGYSFDERILAPNEEFEFTYPVGTGVPDSFDYTDANYIVAALRTSPANDENTANNLSVTPLVPAP